MAFFARPNLDNTQFKQLPDSLLTLSGQTQIANVTGLTISDENGIFIPVIVTGATNYDVLTYSNGQITLQPVAGGGSGVYSGASPTTCTVGGLVSGTPIAGSSISDILESILVPTLNPTLTLPSLSTFTISPTTTIYEVGAVATITGTANFSAGSINPQYPPTASSCRSNGSQCYVYNYFGTPLESIVNSPSNIYPFGSSPIGIGNNVISAKVCYCTGVQPYDSSGNVYNTPLAAGVTNTFLRTITGVFPWYWGKVTCAAAAGVGRPSACCIKDMITGGTYECKCVGLSTSSIEIQFNSTPSDYLWFATPNASSTKTSWYVDTLNSGTIGGGVSPACNLFPAVDTVTNVTTVCWSGQSYKVYVSNYQSCSTAIMEIS